MARRPDGRAVSSPENGRKVTKHGIGTHLTLSPDKWPARSRRMYERRVLSVLSHPHIDEEADIGIVAQVSRLEVLLAHAYEYLMKVAKHNKTLFDENGNPEPAMKFLLTIENTLSRTYDRLLLTPQSRKEFNMKVGESVAMLLSGGGEDETES
jgi:hypothetical protein